MSLWPGGWSGVWVGDWQGEEASDGFVNLGLRAFGASTVTLGLVAGGGATYADAAALLQGSGSLVATLADRGQVSVPGGNRPFVDRDAGQPSRADLHAFLRDESTSPIRAESGSSERTVTNAERECPKDGQRSTLSQHRPRDANSTRRKA